MNSIYKQKWRIILIIAISIILAGFNLYRGLASPVSANPGYTFTAPGGVSLGVMAPRTAPYTGNVSGNFTGDNHDGYTITAMDAKTPDAGYMVSGSNVLHNQFQIGYSAGAVANSGVEQTLLDVTGVQNGTVVTLYFSQQFAYNDPAVSGYTITITYTVTAKP